MNAPYSATMVQHLHIPQAAKPTHLDQVKQYTSKFEDVLEKYGRPLKPYFAGFGRFLIIVTFLEDALRIVTQFNEQVNYLITYSSFLPWGAAHGFLIINVCAMLGGSYFVVARIHSEIGVAALLGVMITQAFGYGLIFDRNFLLKNLSLAGGLFMVLSDSLYRRKVTFAGLPDPSDPKPSHKTYFQLAGRVLLITLFLGLIFRTGVWSGFRMLITMLELVACIMVVVGFKAKTSAMFLVAFLSILNILLNDFWDYRHKTTTRDFLKYDFFQTLSIIGGLLLLVNMGPGELSYDEKKKHH